MTIVKELFHGDPNVGLFGFATDKYFLIPDANIKAEPLGVPQVHSTISGTMLCGMFCAGNSHGLILPYIATDREIEQISRQMKHLGVNVLVLKSRHTAIGNLIVCNDHAALASPSLSHHKSEIEACLNVPVTFGTLAGLEIVGSVCVASNKGFLLNMHADDRDFDLVRDILGTKGDVGTINFGGPFVRSGLVVNSSGAIAGNKTTGPELGRIEEAFGFI